jgi:hypothetical protein
MTPDVNELNESIIDTIVADLDGFERDVESKMPFELKWQWLNDKIKLSNKEEFQL